MHIEQLTKVDDEVIAAFARLLPLLSQATPPDRNELAAIIAASGTFVLVARDDPQRTAPATIGPRFPAFAGSLSLGQPIVGLLTLHLYRIPTGLQAQIDDVVVDDTVRGRGLGEALTRHAIQLARGASARAVHLTSHPRREAANRLYARIGFERRDTNVYRYKLV